MLNKQEQIAYNRGANAREEGKPKEECPYQHAIRYRLLWERGWQEQDRIIAKRGNIAEFHQVIELSPIKQVLEQARCTMNQAAAAASKLDLKLLYASEISGLLDAWIAAFGQDDLKDEDAWVARIIENERTIRAIQFDKLAAEQMRRKWDVGPKGTQI